MHWLTGSSPKTMLNKVWRTVGALDDSVTIHTDEPFLEYDYHGDAIRMYRDVDATEKHLTALSPEDAAEIKTLCGNIRKVKSLDMPVTNIRGLKMTKRTRPPLGLLFSALSASGLFRKFANISCEDYIARFKHEGIRDLLRSCCSAPSGILPFFFTFGVLASGDGGFPEGGSLPFAGRMVKTFQALGGELFCNTRVERVLVENGRAAGVIADGKEMRGDAVIVTADTMAADKLFDPPLRTPWLDKMKAVTVPTAATFVCLGVDADLSNRPHGLVFKLPSPLTVAGQPHEFLSVNNYAADRSYSPAGKTALTLILSGDSYDFWKQARDENRYAAEKQALADTVAEALGGFLPKIRGKVEVCDVATPLTYERYCGNWRGSWMTEMTPSMSMKEYPCTVEGIARLYFAGQRILPPGGLPVALSTGRTAVQHLCRDTGTVFVSEE
jgi:phytoene dehydrogenase-like protein